MKIKTIALIWFSLSCMISGVAQGNDFEITLEASAQVARYSSATQYLNMKLISLNYPEATPPAWYKKVFVKRKDYGIAYFLYTFNNGETLKKSLFQYEKDGNSYKYKYLVPNPSAPAYLLDNQLVQRPFKMQLVVRNWEGENNTALLKKFVTKLNLLSSASPAIASASFKTALGVGTTALDAIEEIFPPTTKEDSGIITIDPNNLRSQYTIKLQDKAGNSNDFSIFTISSSDSLFTQNEGLFDQTLSSYSDKLEGVENWEDIIMSADQETDSGDVGPIVNTLYTYNKYITKLEITNTDKILLLAKSACRWAPLTLQQENISLQKFSEIAVDGAKNVYRKYSDTILRDCEFPEGDCNVPITCQALSFYSKSSNTSLKAKSQKYINGTFDLTLKDGKSISVSVENYKKYFKIRGRSKWDSEGDKENRTYTFKNNNVRVFYNKPGESYNGIAKSMNFYADDDGKFYIGEIIIEES